VPLHPAKCDLDMRTAPSPFEVEYLSHLITHPTCASSPANRQGERGPELTSGLNSLVWNIPSFFSFWMLVYCAKTWNAYVTHSDLRDSVRTPVPSYRPSVPSLRASTLSRNTQKHHLCICRVYGQSNLEISQLGDYSNILKTKYNNNPK